MSSEPLTEKQLIDVTRISITEQLRWLIAHKSDKLADAIHKTMQTYILLQILESLDNINYKLALMNVNIQDVEQEVVNLNKEQEDHELITLDRFIAMLDERGLSSYRYTEPRYSSEFGNYTAHLIDVGKDGKVLATYDIGAIVGTVFTEKCMAKELDGLLDK